MIYKFKSVTLTIDLEAYDIYKVSAYVNADYKPEHTVKTWYGKTKIIPETNGCMYMMRITYFNSEGVPFSQEYKLGNNHDLAKEDYDNIVALWEKIKKNDSEPSSEDGTSSS